ncbi:major facilitator superfamily transporter [Colletotrichum sojae]|uniref:Major facilitator superfamily transporter n=1 Tax=Colletotrichum sojae TaxID=2175907 RepID=A0A8H6IZR5_9PEZI|nr:major facilitator superfamily transporter [Colletotrichum sojae]
MPRLSDEVEAAHLMGPEFPDLDGLPADAPNPGLGPTGPAAFRAFDRTRSKWTTTSSSPSLPGPAALPALLRRINAALLRLQVRSPRGVILLLALLKFSITTSGMLLMIPVLRLVEDGICHRHYGLAPAEPIPEMRCKADEVQREMAWLFGWQSLLGAVVNMGVAFPYGVLSDRIGRKPVLLLAYLGTVLSFSWAPLLLSLFPAADIRLLFAGMLFTLVGGGIVVMFNNVYAMAADVSTEHDRASNFVFLSVGAVVGGLAGPLVAGFLMERLGPWVPIKLVFLFTPFVLLVMVLLPETLRPKADAEEAAASAAADVPMTSAVRDAFANALLELRRSLPILRDRNVLLCLAPPLVQGALMSAHSTTLSQYVSKHFGWTLAQTSYLLSPLGLLHLAVLGILPRVSSLLTDPRGRFRRTAFGKDALLARASFFIIAAGAVVEGVGRDVAVFALGLAMGTLGSASGPLSRAVITAFVDPGDTSRLYALTSMVDTLGSPLGGPALAWTFSVGLERKGIWTGLPWFYVSTLAASAATALVFVGEPRRRGAIYLESRERGSTEGMGLESGADEEP